MPYTYNYDDSVSSKVLYPLSLICCRDIWISASRGQFIFPTLVYHNHITGNDIISSTHLTLLTSLHFVGVGGRNQWKILNWPCTRQSRLTYNRCFYYDDVIKWKHFPRHWPFVRGIHRSPVNSPQKGQWRGALMFSLICALPNRWVNNRDAG